MASTEHGAIMAATILNSPRAEQMSVYVVRAFVKLRESLSAHTVLARELATLKSCVDTLDDDTLIAALGFARSYCFERPKPTKFGTAGIPPARLRDCAHTNGAKSSTGS
jgi:hypothetical protein